MNHPQTILKLIAFSIALVGFSTTGFAGDKSEPKSYENRGAKSYDERSDDDRSQRADDRRRDDRRDRYTDDRRRDRYTDDRDYRDDRYADDRYRDDRYYRDDRRRDDRIYDGDRSYGDERRDRVADDRYRSRNEWRGHMTDPFDLKDDTRITLSGKARNIDDDEFILDYGEGEITVEMEDWDWYAADAATISGNKVTVYGVIDDDFFSDTEIEADRIFVENLNSFFYANDFDPEHALDSALATTVDVAAMELRGTVTEIDDDEIVINTGSRAVRVELEELDFDPLDDDAYAQITMGDRVLVTGEMDDDFLEGREFVADTLILLTRDETYSMWEGDEQETYSMSN